MIIAPNHKPSGTPSSSPPRRTADPLHGQERALRGARGKLLIRLGAFPVRRGSSDEDAIETARQILLDGGLLALFPEGTRVRDPTILGKPHKGAARLALETGATVIPCAITGTEKLFAGPLPRPGRSASPSASRSS